MQQVKKYGPDKVDISYFKVGWSNQKQNVHMKGKGNKDVFILNQEGFVPPEPTAPMKKNSIRKSILLTSDQVASSLFSRRVRLTQNEGQDSPNSPTEYGSEGRGVYSRRAMPSIEEINEDKHHGEEDIASKLSKGDLSSSHDSEEQENPDSLEKRDSDKVITLDHDVAYSPRRSQSRNKIQATKIPSFHDVMINDQKPGSPRSSPFMRDRESKKEGLNLVGIPVPEDGERSGDSNSFMPDMPDEMDSPGLKNMKRRIKEEHRLSNLSAKNNFMKRTSIANLQLLNELIEPAESKEDSPIDKARDLEQMDETEAQPRTFRQSPRNNLIIPILTPEDSPKKDQLNQLDRLPRMGHRLSLKYNERDNFARKLSEIGDSALHEIRTPQGPRSMPLKEAQLVQNKRESMKMSKNVALRYGTKDEISIAFSRKGSMDDPGSDSESEKSQSNSGDEELEDFTEFEKNSDQAAQVLKSSKFLNEYKRKLAMRYPNIANLCLGIVCLDMVLSEFYFFSDEAIKHQDTSYHIAYFFVILLALILIVMRVNLYHYSLFKGLVLLLLFGRLLADFVEVYLYYGSHSKPLQSVLKLKDIQLRAMVQTIYFTSSGLFFPIENLVVNVIYFVSVAAHQAIYINDLPVLLDIFELFVFCAFNVVECWIHYKFELRCFYSMSVSNKTSIQYIKFVNRLLPTHSNTLSSRSETFTDVTILFADICGFTDYSSKKASRQVVEMLSKLFTEFDIECNRLNLFKLYTIGDCYVVMGFMDKRNRKSPAEEAHDVVQLGISMIRIIAKVRKMIKFDGLNMRIGIHTGSMVYGGLIGTEIVRFDLYGPDLVIANKMESGGQEGHINISERTKILLEELQTANYTFEENQKIYIKSIDEEIQSYFVRYSDSDNHHNAPQ